MMKKDKYRRARGGTAVIYVISCVKCGKDIIEYQKDGTGFLHRCYLNRIIAPEKYSCLQADQNIAQPKNLPPLACECGEIIGYPMRHSDGRLAFRLEHGKSKKQRK